MTGSADEHSGGDTNEMRSIVHCETSRTYYLNSKRKRTRLDEIFYSSYRDGVLSTDNGPQSPYVINNERP